LQFYNNDSYFTIMFVSKFCVTSNLNGRWERNVGSAWDENKSSIQKGAENIDFFDVSV